ncbi:helix-turn-helix transcriptional regulator [Gordonia malaquae]|uniref:helix-turn-helix domain-containing protein n=1 Tax=Gordonia malaquae TaxID=410332 RepID=UPI0030196FE8
MTRSNAPRGIIPELTDAQRLTVAREFVGLNQGELAERLGVSAATVQRAEAGKTQIRRTTLMAWSMATGIDLHWLETGHAPADPDGPDEGVEQDNEAAFRRESPLSGSNRRPSV